MAPIEAELLQHATALRAMARALVGTGQADDLVQEVTLQALQRPPLQPGPIRGWLVAILHHFASKRRRTEQRRPRHEAMAPQPEPPWPPDRIAAHRDAVERLLAALVALPEPYHGTLLLRFFEDLTPAAIARATGVPVATVKSRLQRGLALLRERLDDGGKGRDWRAAFMASGLPASATSAMLVQGVVMGMGVKLTLGGVAAAAMFIAFAVIAPEPVVQTDAAAVAEPAALVTATSKAGPPPAAEQSRTEVTEPAAHADTDVRITGTVVDQDETPIAGVSIGSQVVGRSRGHSVITTSAGRFEMVRGTGDPTGRPYFWLQKDGYAPLVTERIDWGTRDLRLQMLPCSQFELHVTDAAQRPVERFRVRLWPGNGVTALSSSTHPEARASGTHHGGIATVVGWGRGAHHLVVEPDDGDLQASRPQLVPAGPATTTRVDVRLLRKATRTVHVEHADGSLAVAVELMLVEPLGAGMALQTPVRDVEELAQYQDREADQALLLQQVTTDAQGNAQVRGPSDRGCALRLCGPGHPPMVVAPVDLNVAAPLLVRLSAGVRLEGRLTPDAAVAMARSFALETCRGRGLRTMSAVRMGLRLQRTIDDRYEQVPDQEHSGVQIGADGTFFFTGAPAGSFQLVLDTILEGPLLLAQVVLTEGRTTVVEVNLPGLAPGHIEGQVLRNGVPLANSLVQLLIGRDPMATGKIGYRGEGVHTDGDGRFQFTWHSGTYRVNLLENTDSRSDFVRSREEVFVAAGASVTQVFHVDVASFRLRLLDANGRPVARVPLCVVDPWGSRYHETDPTDRDGWTTCDVEAGGVAVEVLPRRLLDREEQERIRNADPGASDPFTRLRLRLREATARAGEQQELELRLPPDWDR